MIRAYFDGVGNNPKSERDSTQYYVSSIKDLAVIIDHLNKYPLITQKRADYVLFKSVVEMINRKEHLTIEGIKKIVAIKASSNNGLTEELKAAFPDVIPVPRPLVADQVVQDPNWLAGFVEGEGCFSVQINNSSSHKSGFQVQLRFYITQHSRDYELIKNLEVYLGCGRIISNVSAINFVVSSLSHITEIILPFFEKYPLQGAKTLDYADFCRVAELMKAGGHLTKEGLEEIHKIKSGINRGRSK